MINLVGAVPIVAIRVREVTPPILLLFLCVATVTRRNVGRVELRAPVAVVQRVARTHLANAGAKV